MSPWGFVNPKFWTSPGHLFNKSFLYVYETKGFWTKKRFVYNLSRTSPPSTQARIHPYHAAISGARKLEQFCSQALSAHYSFCAVCFPFLIFHWPSPVHLLYIYAFLHHPVGACTSSTFRHPSHCLLSQVLHISGWPQPWSRMFAIPARRPWHNTVIYFSDFLHHKSCLCQLPNLKYSWNSTIC
jgi:hypothetical protein